MSPLPSVSSTVMGYVLFLRWITLVLGSCKTLNLLLSVIRSSIPYPTPEEGGVHYASNVELLDVESILPVTTPLLLTPLSPAYSVALPSLPVPTTIE